MNFKLQHIAGTVLLASAISWVTGPSTSVAQGGADSAALVVRALYDDHLNRVYSGQQPVFLDENRLKLYFDDAIAQSMARTNLGFDPFLDAQDFEISNLVVSPDPQTPILQGAAQINATFLNFGAPQTISYTLVQVPGGEWQITGIFYANSNASLRDMIPPARPVPGAPEITLGQTQQAARPVPAPTPAPAPARPTNIAQNNESNIGMEQGDLPGFSPDPSRSDLLFILDGSGSMWGQVDGVTKIETAKTALKRMATDLYPTLNLGLMAYGHNREGDCSDIEVMLPVGSYDERAMDLAVNDVTPRGKTPIATALSRAADAIPPGDRQANVLLLSDGLETCNGDPCVAAASLAARGIDTKIHVVGFDLTSEEQEALACIAREGGGLYFTADNANELQEALSQVASRVAEPEPEPVVEPETTLLFEDLFDGEALSSVWSVQNPAPSLARLDGAGAFFTSAVGESHYRSETARNLLVLNQDLPSGDFDIVLETRLARQTGSENVSISLVEDLDNQIVAELHIITKGCGSALSLSLIRVDDSESSVVTIDLFDGPYADAICRDGRVYANEVLQTLADEGAVLKMKRRGRDLTASVTMNLPSAEGQEGGEATVETEAVSILRLRGAATLLGGQRKSAGKGESHVWFDRFAIEEPAS